MNGTLRYASIVLLGTLTLVAHADTPTQRLTQGQLLAERIEKLIRPHWNRVDPATVSRHNNGDTGNLSDVSWRPILSPPFSDAWPPNGRGGVRYHVYAIGLRSGLSDATHVSVPWARVSLNFSSPKAPKVSLTGPVLSSLGIQGVTPVQRSAWQRIDAGADAMLEASKRPGLPEGEMAQRIRRGYCTWLKLNELVAKSLVSQESPLMRWLACKTVDITTR